MTGLEHKDERLHAVEGADWRDALAVKRRELETVDCDDTPDTAGGSETVTARRDPPPDR